MSLRIDNPAYYPPPNSRRRLWPLRLIGTLALVVQGAGIYAVVFFFTQFAENVRQTLVRWEIEPERAAGAAPLVSGFSYLLLLKPLAVLLVIAGLGFAWGRWSGWLLAMLAQCFVLYTCLSLYFLGPPLLATYPIMMSSIVMALFLNSTGVRMLFPAGLRTTR